MLKLTEIIALIYEVTDDNSWRMGKRGHLFARRVVHGHELEVRTKDYKWALVKKGYWRFEIERVKLDDWYSDGSLPVLNGVQAKLYFLPKYGPTFSKIEFARGFVHESMVKTFVETDQDRFENDCVLLRLFSSFNID